MRKILLLWGLIGAGIFLSGGCTAIPAEKEAGREVAVAKSPVGEKLTEALVQNNPEAFLAGLPELLQTQFPAEKFQATRKALCKSLGEPVSFRYLGKIEHPLLDVEVWLIRFERTAEDGNIIHQEALFRVISGILDEKPRIISFNFL